MSTWTHVVGIIRFDGIASLGSEEPDCGFTCDYEDDEDIWDRCNIPCGSEGSLQISKWTNPSNSALSRWTYSIFGDLRDYGNYEDEQKIIDYFNKVIKGQMIRQACFSFQVEGDRELRTFVYDDKSKLFVEVSQQEKEHQKK